MYLYNVARIEAEETICYLAFVGSFY